MKKNYIFKSISFKAWMIILLLGISSSDVFAQSTNNPIYATSQSSVQNSSYSYSVTFVGSFSGATTFINAAAGAASTGTAANYPNNYTTIRNSGTNYVLNTTSHSTDGTLKLTFPCSVDAGITSYIRVNTYTPGIATLDPGSTVTVTAQTSGGANAGGTVTTVTGAAGELYYAITPTSAYTAVSINAAYATTAVNNGLDFTNDLLVYYAYADIPTLSDCGRGVTTSTSISSVLSVGLTGAVTNPGSAIDADTTNSKASFSVVAGVAATISETIYFNGPSSLGDGVKLIIDNGGQSADNILKLGLLNGTTFQAFYGSTPVGTAQTLNTSLINLDLLNLFSSGAKTGITFYPSTTAKFDNIVVSYSTLLSVSVTGAFLNIYEVARIPAAPTATTASVTATTCTASSVNLVATSPQKSDSYSSACSGASSNFATAASPVTYTWTSPSGTVLLTTSTTDNISTVPVSSLLTSTQLGTPGTYTVYVAVNKNGCTIDGLSTRTAESITLNSCALPLTLLGFNAIKGDGKVNLSWYTANEQNTSGFVVERSADATSFQPVATVAAVGSGDNNYATVDASPLNGISFYRLKSIDKDGSFAYSSTIKVNFEKNNVASIYPSPATNYLRVNITSASLLGTQATFVDFSGRVLKAINIASSSQQVDVSGFAAGVYFVKLVDGSSLKFVKQ